MTLDCGDKPQSRVISFFAFFVAFLCGFVLAYTPARGDFQKTLAKFGRVCYNVLDYKLPKTQKEGWGTHVAKEKKNKKWVRLRHSVITHLAYFVMYPYSKWKYKIKVERFREEKKRQYLILLNHQTVFDQFFVGMSFRRALYYIATEDIFSNGWVSSLIRFVVAPIPIKKQTTDIAAVRNCIRVANEGGSIVLAPEGNRTYSGKTEYMNPSVAWLARKLDLPIALYRIEGGYGAQPRWSDTIRKGSMRAYVSRVIEPEEYKSMTNDELFEVIEKGLFVDEGCVDVSFRGKRRAEYLERAMYVCPTCGLSTFFSEKNTVRCQKCGLEAEYGESKELTGVGCEFPFRFVTEWYRYQCDFVNQLDTAKHMEEPLYRDRIALSEVIINKKKVLLQPTAEVALFGDRIEIDADGQAPTVFPFEAVTAISVLGRNKLNVYHDKRVYQFKGDKHFNALKYVNIYYRNKNIAEGNPDGKFLGL